MRRYQSMEYGVWIVWIAGLRYEVQVKDGDEIMPRWEKKKDSNGGGREEGQSRTIIGTKIGYVSFSFYLRGSGGLFFLLFFFPFELI